MFDKTKAYMQHMIETRICPGYIAAFVHDTTEEVVMSGNKAIVPQQEVMTLDSQFDIASLTKVVGTTTVIYQLLDEGKLHLNDRVNQYLPITSSDLTLRHLLTHTSDFQGYIENRNALEAKPLAQALLNDMTPGNQLGNVVTYSDINFLYLGWIVESITGKPIQTVIEERVLHPLKMNDTTTTPDVQRAVPTEHDVIRGYIRGSVHDPKTYRLAQHSGSAGLFSTVSDLIRFVQMYLRGGQTEQGKTIIPASIWPHLSQSYTKETMRLYSLGWNLEKVNHHYMLTHTGYTGTYLSIDLIKQQGFIFLSNRIHPNDYREAYIKVRDGLIRQYIDELEEQ